MTKIIIPAVAVTATRQESPKEIAVVTAVLQITAVHRFLNVIAHQIVVVHRLLNVIARQIVVVHRLPAVIVRASMCL